MLPPDAELVYAPTRIIGAIEQPARVVTAQTGEVPRVGQLEDVQAFALNVEDLEPRCFAHDEQAADDDASKRRLHLPRLLTPPTKAAQEAARDAIKDGDAVLEAVYNK